MICHVELRVSTKRVIIMLHFIKCTHVFALVSCKYFVILQIFVCSSFNNFDSFNKINSLIIFCNYGILRELALLWLQASSLQNLETQPSSLAAANNLAQPPQNSIFFGRWGDSTKWHFTFSRCRVWTWDPSGIWRRVVWLIDLMMEAARSSETSIYFFETTWRHIPEGCHLHIPTCSHCSQDTSANIK
jgi:hypothetical protein